MSEIAPQLRSGALLREDELGLGALGSEIGPSHAWSHSPYLTSSDLTTYRTADGFAADARDASRSNPYGLSARRSTTDAIVGSRLTLQLDPDSDVLGVSDEEAAEWAERVERRWEQAANSSFFPMDAQRKQTFTGLMRTACDCRYVSGEALATIEWKVAPNGQRTCMNLIDRERLSDPYGMQDLAGRRRMGVERDKHGAPLAYHIREKHPSDNAFWGPWNGYSWKRVPRYTGWGRQNVLHVFDHDRPDMTRGNSSYTTALQSMRLLNDYMMNELESAAVRATYAAVIQSKLNYEDAMKVIGAEGSPFDTNPFLKFTLQRMTESAAFYRGQDFRFGKSKVAHLLPDEELKMIQGTQNASALKDYSAQNLYTLASALGVDYASLTKDYSHTNYSGARAALYDVWRSYEVRRSSLLEGFAWPFFICWLEEMVALRGEIPMLGSQSFYAVTEALCQGSFETWTKPRLDPLKEVQADLELYKRGAMSLRDLCKQDGRDYRRVLKERAREKALMKELDLEPQDIDWDLIMNQGAQADIPKPEAGGGGGNS